MTKLRANFDTGDVERLSGEIDILDPIPAATINGVAVNNTPSGAGELLVSVDPANAQWAAAPDTSASEWIVGQPVTINNNAGGTMTWDTKNAGAALLDLTNPAAPAVVAAGLYTVAVAIVPNAAMTAAGYYSVSLRLDHAGVDAALSVTSPQATAAGAGQNPRASVTGVWKLAAGATLAALVANLDGVQNLDFVLSALIGKA